MPSRQLKAYEKTRKNTVSGREIEATVLQKAALNLRRCKENWKDGEFDSQLDEALRFNQRIWSIFNADWQRPEHEMPKELRQNLLSLSVFIRKTSLEIMARPDAAKVDSLIQINENLATGLRAKEEGQSGIDSLKSEG